MLVNPTDSTYPKSAPAPLCVEIFNKKSKTSLLPLSIVKQ